MSLVLRALTLAAVLALAVTGCGGGGGGGDNSPPIGSDPPPIDPPPPDPPPPDPPPPDPPPPPVTVTLEEAARFAAQATFGADYGLIEQIAESGYETWLDAQFEAPVSNTTQVVFELAARADGSEAGLSDPFLWRRLAWWDRAFGGEDLLRQRVALALSEIFVVSDRVDTLIVEPTALSTYWDMLLAHAFGNYRELLLDVTLHPAMGVYLSHLNNRKADPATGRFPDENYAREVMQLFSIGLYELNPDASRKTDSNGEWIPTYGNEQIEEFAKIFTGLVSAPPRPTYREFQPWEIFFLDPMIMDEAAHEPGEKRLLNGWVVDAGQPGIADIESAIDNLFQHPNTGPFIGRQLIQRLVTSNPGPEYVGRIAAVFEDNGNGQRGDLKAMIRAILLDPEARDANNFDIPEYGRLQEPLVRYLQQLRTFRLTSSTGRYFLSGFEIEYLTKQHALSAPSVFNFFRPDHRPNNVAGQAGLQAPEFQILTADTVTNNANLVLYTMYGDEPVFKLPDDMANYFLDVTEELLLAENDPEGLMDRLDLLLTYGRLTIDSRQIIVAAIEQLPEPTDRVSTAVFLLMNAPEYAVAN